MEMDYNSLKHDTLLFDETGKDYCETERCLNAAARELTPHLW